MERVIFSDNGTLIDYTTELNCFTNKTATINYTNGEDYLFIGSDLPFNNKYFMVSTPNAVTGVNISVEYWDGNSWVAAIDVIDETKTANKPLGQSGHVSWNFDGDLTGWSYDDTDDMTGSGLSTLKIYNLYWLRISWSGSLTSTTALQYIGQKFSEDADLGNFYPEMTLTATKTQFASGKNTWNEQHIIAADNIIRDLQVRGVIKHRNQILDWRLFVEPSIHKVAEIIFLAFGDDFKDNRKAAQEYYNQALKIILPQVDRNNNGTLDPDEKMFRTGFMTR